MNRIVAWVAPQNAADFFVKLVIFLLLIGAMNYMRDMLGHGPNSDSYIHNLIEGTYVALPFCVFALALVQHMKKLQDQLVHLARTDLLTELPNRRAFLEALSDKLPEPGGVLMMVDVDHFKTVNDTFGHAVGDICLQHVARSLKQHIRPVDIAARLGGEEFGILLVAPNPDDVRDIGAHIARGIDLPIAAQALTLQRVTTSIGAVRTDGYSDIAALMRAADQALYRAKDQGRGRLIMADAAAVPTLLDTPNAQSA